MFAKNSSSFSSALGSFCFGFLLVFLIYRASPPVNSPKLELPKHEIIDLSQYEQQLAAATPALPDNAARCLENATNCPHFDDNQLEHDWPIRFWKSGRGGCYFEFDTFSASCGDACDSLLVENSGVAGFPLQVKHHIAKSCRVGCGYARRMRGSKVNESCIKDCKRTVWPETPTSMAVEGFSSDKACEIGCLIGNERPCPFCDTRVVQ